MKPSALISCLLAVACCDLAPALAAEPPATAPGISSDVQSALDDLCADSFDTRQAAETRLEMLIAKDYRNLAANKELYALLSKKVDAGTLQNLQLPDPYPAADDARIAEIADRNYAISRFAAIVLGQPRDRQGPLLSWADSEQGLALISRAYSPQTSQRVAATKDLAANDIPEAAWILAQMIADDDREVELAAIDAAWDKKPTPELVDALWNRAIYSPNYSNFSRRSYASAQKIVTVRGRQVSVYQQDYNAGYRQQDVDIVCDLLARMNDPIIKQRLVQMLNELVPRLLDHTDYQLQQILLGNGQNNAMGKLITAYKAREAAPLLMRVVGAPNMQDSVQWSNGNKMYRSSTRIAAAALVVQIAGEDPAAHGLTMQPSFNRWAVEGTETEENKFIEEMNKWWAAHAKEFGQVPVPGAAPANTDPFAAPGAATPALDPAQLEDLKRRRLQTMGGR